MLCGSCASAQPKPALRSRSSSWRSHCSDRCSLTIPQPRIYGRPFASPTAAHPLGLDFNGRDVLSRVLWGGRSLIGYALLATVLAYIMGLSAGLVAGYVRSIVDPLVMRFVDFLLAFPPLLFLLVLLTGVIRRCRLQCPLCPKADTAGRRAAPTAA